MAYQTKRASWRMAWSASLLTVTIMGAGAGLTPLSAQSAEDWAQMRADMDAMKADMDAMEARLDAQDAELAKARAEADAANARADAAEAKLAAVPGTAVEAPAKPETAINWKGAPEIKGPNGWSFKLRGRLQYDAGYIAAPSGLNTAGLGLGFGNEMRRARLGVQGEMPGGFGYKFEVDFANNSVALTDAYISYAKGDVTITAGQHNNFQSMEELTSSNDVSFIERTGFTDAFGFERRLGLSAEWAKGPVLVQAGVFSDDASALANDDDNAMSFDGRLVFAPKVGRTQLHLGASAHWRDLGASNSGVRYRQRPLVAFTDTRFIDTGVFSATNENSFGVEGAFISGRFHGLAEGHWLTVKRPGVADPKFFGGALELGYFLTPHSRSYGGGMFKATKVKDGVDKGGIGAVQLNVRYDHVDLNDQGALIFGGTQDAYMASLIWTPIDYVRVLLNYAHISYDDSFYSIGTNRNYSVDVIGGRLQISF